MIRIVEDVVAPLTVTAVNIATRQSTSLAKYNDWAIYGMTALGYAGAFMNLPIISTPFFKNLGIASLPLTADRLYSKFKKGGATVTRLGRYPAEAVEPAFRGTRLV